jgi:hypothetical protein
LLNSRKFTVTALPECSNCYGLNRFRHITNVPFSKFLAAYIPYLNIAMPGMKNVTITNRLLHFVIILPYCGYLYLAVTINVIVFIAVKSCMFV